MKTILKVDGMSCGHCEANVKGSLTKLAGISEVEVSLTDKEVAVSYDAEKVTIDNIKDTIEDLGFDVIS